MRRNFLYIGTGLFLLATACRRDDTIQTYRVTKDASPTMPMASAPMMGSNVAPALDNSSGGSMEASPGTDMNAMGASLGMTPAASSKEIQWKVPAGWKEQTPSAMRVGQLSYKGPNGQTADMSVVPLSGKAGGDLANINRWRGQINLDPISENDLPQNSQSISPAGRKMRLVDFVSREPLIGNRYKKRLITAIYTQGDRSWFFKMMGEDRTVKEAKPAFLEFLKNLRFHDPA